ncbi:hypothetical protein [Pelagibius sp.]|uniref:hypothetical protein n=1 Tax=Pelagibius sp. TaxID=1931238 RepID=UPI003BB1CDC1
MATKNSQDGIPSNQPEESGEALGKQDTTVINPPPPGEEIAVFVGDSANLQFRFEPTAIQVAQVDGDLLLRFPNDGQVAPRSFDEENGDAPQIVLPDGTPIDGDDLLQQLQTLPPLETAAGPEGNGGNPSTGGGGTSVYQSDFGNLLFSLTGNTGGGGVEDVAADGNAGVSTPGAPTPPARGPTKRGPPRKLSWPCAAVIRDRHPRDSQRFSCLRSIRSAPARIRHFSAGLQITST